MAASIRRARLRPRHVADRDRDALAPQGQVPKGGPATGRQRRSDGRDLVGNRGVVAGLAPTVASAGTSIVQPVRAVGERDRPDSAAASVSGTTRQRLVSVPMPSISTTTSSPSARNTRRLAEGADPARVPVAMTSPGSRVKNREQNAISSATPWISSAVVASWRDLPVHPTAAPGARRGSGISSAVTIHGPIGQNVSRLLPASTARRRPAGRAPRRR